MTNTPSLLADLDAYCSTTPDPDEVARYHRLHAALQEHDALRARVEALENQIGDIEEENARLETDWVELRTAAGQLETERNTLAAGVEALRLALEQADIVIHAHRFLRKGYGVTDPGWCDFCEALNSTPALDLAAHDERVKREVVDQIISAAGTTRGVPNYYRITFPVNPADPGENFQVMYADLESSWFYHAAGIPPSTETPKEEK